MLDRRRFLMSVIAAAATPSATATPNRNSSFGRLRPDPGRLLDLPDGFGYAVVSRAGDRMDDGFRVPAAHDGMAAFAAKGGRVALVCNHENAAAASAGGIFDGNFADLPDAVRRRWYDPGGGLTPGAGGTTTTIYDLARRTTLRQHLSLAGTEVNCAGGPTPWGSWLSCEECFHSPGVVADASPVTRERRHGYVFEVPAGARGLVEPVPLRAMGRFEHEAAAVDRRTGAVYMTEDQHHGLFYRFLPDVPGKLAAGGRLQAMAIPDAPGFSTHNWGAEPSICVGRPMPVRWIDLEDVDPDENDLRLRGAAAGAATFARGEGLTAAGDAFAFTCTIGGLARLGQVFVYRPETSGPQATNAGTLTLIAEAGEESLLRNADNLTAAPWGDLVVCEDTADHCGIVGVRPDGTQYLIADHAWSDSELAGICFSPDGSTLFVNVQFPGTTLAITGPWPKAENSQA